MSCCLWGHKGSKPLVRVLWYFLFCLCNNHSREDTSSLALDVQPQEVIVDENSGDVPHKAKAEGGQLQDSMAESLQELKVESEQEASEQSDGESHKTRTIDPCEDSAEMEPKLEEMSSVQEGTWQAERSLQEEMQEVERGAGAAGNGAGVLEGGTESQERSTGAGRREDDYVAQEEVEGYLARMKQEGENYVDEHQVLLALQHLFFFHMRDILKSIDDFR